MLYHWHKLLTWDKGKEPSNTLPSPFPYLRGPDSKLQGLPALKQQRRDISSPLTIPAQQNPLIPRGWMGVIMPKVHSAACSGLFPFPFASAFPGQISSVPVPQAQQELSQQPARADDIPTAFPGKHFMGWNESNSKEHRSQACSVYRGFSKMCQFI